MHRINKLFFFILFTLFSACEKEEPIIETEIYGKITDIESGSPVVNATVNFITFEGVDNNDKPITKVKYSALTNSDGNYSIKLPDVSEEEIYSIVPIKNNYVLTSESKTFPISIELNKRNQNNFFLAKGSYLRLAINKVSAIPERSLKLDITYNRDESGSVIYPEQFINEQFDFNSGEANVVLLRDYHYQKTTRVDLKWELITSESNSEIQTFSETIFLTEHDTVDFEINY